MALKVAVPGCRCFVKGDGTDVNVTIIMATAPIEYTDALPSASFSLAAALPSAVANVHSSGGHSVSGSYVALTGILTVTYATALGAGVFDQVVMDLEF